MPDTRNIICFGWDEDEKKDDDDPLMNVFFGTEFIFPFLGGGMGGFNKIFRSQGVLENLF